MRKLLILLPLLLGSCNAISSLIHDDQVVAKVGDNKLYKSEVEGFIPNMIPASDSVRLAEQYINSWAMDLLYLDVAEKELSNSELDVAAELAGRAVVAKCNVDDCEEIAVKYGIRNIPTLLYFKNGELADRTVGIVPKQEIITRLENLM